MSSQEIFDSLCNLNTTWSFADRNYIDNLKNISTEQISYDDPLAMNNLGFIFFKDKSYPEAERLFLMAAEHKNPVGMFNLGDLYGFESDFSNHDIKISEMWFMRAADHGFVPAMTNLGSLYKRNGDYKKAEELYLKAAELDGQARGFV
jgi:TPR repeat protein